MKFRVVAYTLLGGAFLACGHADRDYSSAGHAGSGGDEAGASAGGSAAAGHPGTGGSAVGGNSGTSAGEGGAPGPAAGAAGESAEAGAAGERNEPPDLCIGKVCSTPPADGCESGTQFRSHDKTGTCEAGVCSYASHEIACTCTAGACTTDPCASVTCASPPGAICKDANTLTKHAATGTCSGGNCSYAPTDSTCPFGCANGACKADPCNTLTCTTPPKPTCKDSTTRTTYAAGGTCSAGSCSYAATNTACSGATPSCKDPGTGAQCVACGTSSQCSNGGSCNSAGACVCSARYNGNHCEFQVFRGIGVLQGDTDSEASNVSHDGMVVVGYSYQGASVNHAVRSVNGAALQFLAEPSSLTPVGGCAAIAVDASGTVLMQCEQKPFLYTPATGVVAVDASPFMGPPNDISSDGKVIVGTKTASPQQQYRHANGATSLLGVLEPGGTNYSSATNSDGTVVVGFDGISKDVATRWTASTGLVALSGMSGWNDYLATDVTPDGTVIVGEATSGTTAWSALKWFGGSLTLTVLGPGAAYAVNGDGSVVIGSDVTFTIPMLWDGTGAHSITALLGATPDITADWTLSSVAGISDDGKVIVGNGLHGTHSEGWVAHLP
jgi:hypothetical protein